MEYITIYFKIELIDIVCVSANYVHSAAFAAHPHKIHVYGIYDGQHDIQYTPSYGIWRGQKPMYNYVDIVWLPLFRMSYQTSVPFLII